MRTLIVFLVLVLAGCASPFDVQPGDVILHIRTDAQLQKDYQRLMKKAGKVNGKTDKYDGLVNEFTLANREPCEIWLRIDLEWLEHALRHCREGVWHD